MKNFILLVLLSLSTFSYAQSPTKLPSVKYHDLPDGRRIFVPYSSPLRSPGEVLYNQALAMVVDQKVQVGQTMSVPNPAGTLIPATAKGTLTPSALSASVGRVGNALSRSLAPIGLGLAFFDLAVELGHSARRALDGRLEITKNTKTPSGIFPDSTYASCKNWSGVDGTESGVGCTELDSTWYTGYPSSGLFKPKNSSVPWDLRYVDTYTMETKVIPMEEFLVTVAGKSTWMADSKIIPVVLQDPNPELQTPQQITVSGQASSPGAVAKTVNTTNNTTKTETTNYNYTYEGDTIITKIINNTDTVDNSTGAVTNSSTTTTTAPTVNTPPESPTSTASDTPLPAQPKLYTPVYPKGLQGVWDEKKTQLKSAPLTALSSSLMPNVGSSGSCPSMPINLTFSSWANYGTKDVAPPCYVWDWAKAIVILGALLLARALIFGG